MSHEVSFTRLFTTTGETRALIAAGIYKKYHLAAGDPERAAVAMLEQLAAQLVYSTDLELLIKRVREQRARESTMVALAQAGIPVEQQLGAGHPPLESIATPDGVRAVGVEDALPDTVAQVAVA